MTDSTGAGRARYDYDLWGKRTKVFGDVDADFGFTGHYTHATSGLVLALYRAYDPELGRWISRDPIEEEGVILRVKTRKMTDGPHFDDLDYTVSET